MKKFNAGDRVVCFGYDGLDGESATVVEYWHNNWVLAKFDNPKEFMHNGGKYTTCDHYLLPENDFIPLVESEPVETVNELLSKYEDKLDEMAKLVCEYVKLGKEVGMPVEVLEIAVRFAYM